MLAHAYEYILAIAHSETLTQAAQSLYISQPALTKYINRLEQNLGIKLINRNQVPITFTPAGKLFLKKADAILMLQKQLLDELQSPSATQPQYLHLGMTPEACSLSLPYILLGLKRKYPNLQLKILEGQNNLLKEKLQSHQIDLALMAQTSPKDPDEFSLTHLENEPILLAIPQSFPICRQFDLGNNSPLTPYYLNPAEINSLDFVLCNNSLGMGQTARLIFQKYHIHPHIVMETARNETALRLASAGLGAAFCPIRTPLRIGLIYPMAYFSLESPLLTRQRWIYTPKNEKATPFKTECIHFIQRLYREQSEMTIPVCQLLTIRKKS